MGEFIKAGSVALAEYPQADNTDSVKAWMRYAASKRALLETENAYKNFVAGSFSSWKASYDASRAEEPPPGVPVGKDALMSDDGFDYTLIPSLELSGPAPAYTKRVVTPSSGSIKSVVSAPGLLIGQIGVPMTQKDGTVWVRLS